MTPKWIHNNAVITGPHTLYPQYLELLPTTGASYQRALQVQLVAPNILTSTDSVTVTVTVAVDASYASSNDHDPSIGISDELFFCGIQVPDRHSNNRSCYVVTLYTKFCRDCSKVASYCNINVNSTISIQQITS